MAEPFLGELKLISWNYPPKGWAFANGQFLPINQNQALFSLFGTMYGGNGQTTFALPDLRGRVPTHVGQGPGLSPKTQGEAAGEETHTLIATEMPAHAHAQPASSAQQDTNRPGNAVPAKGGVFAGPADGTVMDPTTVSGGSQPHNNMPPY